MPNIADPRGDELEAMLAALKPRQELVYRMALAGLSRHCRSDRHWRDRIEELRRGLNTNALAKVLRKVDESISPVDRRPVRRKFTR